MRGPTIAARPLLERDFGNANFSDATMASSGMVTASPATVMLSTEEPQTLELFNDEDSVYYFKAYCNRPRSIEIRPRLGIVLPRRTATLEVSPKHETVGSCKVEIRLVRGTPGRQVLTTHEIDAIMEVAKESNAFAHRLVVSVIGTFSSLDDRDAETESFYSVSLFSSMSSKDSRVDPHRGTANAFAHQNGAAPRSIAHSYGQEAAGAAEAFVDPSQETKDLTPLPGQKALQDSSGELRPMERAAPRQGVPSQEASILMLSDAQPPEAIADGSQGADAGAAAAEGPAENSADDRAAGLADALAHIRSRLGRLEAVFHAKDPQQSDSSLARIQADVCTLKDAVARLSDQVAELSSRLASAEPPQSPGHAALDRIAALEASVKDLTHAAAQRRPCWPRSARDVGLAVAVLFVAAVVVKRLMVHTPK